MDLNAKMEFVSEPTYTPSLESRMASAGVTVRQGNE